MSAPWLDSAGLAALDRALADTYVVAARRRPVTRRAWPASSKASALVGIDSDAAQIEADAAHRSARMLVDEAESERDAANAQARAATVARGLN